MATPDLIERLRTPGADLYSDAMDSAVIAYSTTAWMDRAKSPSGEDAVRNKIAAAIRSYNDEILGAGRAPFSGALENQGCAALAEPGAPSNTQAADALARQGESVQAEPEKSENLAQLIAVYEAARERVEQYGGYIGDALVIELAQRGLVVTLSERGE